MSAEQPPYNERYIQAWTALSILLAVLLFGAFVLQNHLLQGAGVAWDLIRYLNRPII